MKNLKRLLIYAVIFIVLFIGSFVFIGWGTTTEEGVYIITVNASYDVTDTLQVFYGDATGFSQENSTIVEVVASDKDEAYVFDIPKSSDYVRLDFGAVINNAVRVSSIEITEQDSELVGIIEGGVLEEYIQPTTSQGMALVSTDESGLNVVVLDEDPYMVIEMKDLQKELPSGSSDVALLISMVLAIIIATIGTFIVYKYIRLKSIYAFVLDVIRTRRTIWKLAKNDFKSKHLTSFLGVIWGFVQPLVTILVFWFVFEIGFRSAPVNDVPFIVWFVPAFLSWNFFSETLNSSANCLREYSYLVKKVNFRVSMIPIVKVISSTFVHVAFIGFIVFLMLVYGVGMSVYNIQVLYYFICTLVLLVGLGWLLSAISVFAGDVANLVNVVIQIGFWMTPIFWSVDSMSPLVVNVLKAVNPMFYVVRGYRDSFVDKVWFWEYPLHTLYFWVVALGIFAVGAVVFKKLRPHFADVL